MSIKVDVEKTLVYGCLHTPVQDLHAEEALLDFIRYWKPKRIIQNGDIHDLNPISKYFKMESREGMLKDEAVAATDHNLAVRKAAGKDCLIVRNWGNHEARYDVYLAANPNEITKAFPEDVAFDKQFGLDAAGIIPNRGKQNTYARFMLGKIQVGHFEVALKHSGDTEKSLVDSKGISVIASHSHRKGVFYKTIINDAAGKQGQPKTLMGIGTGCLCDLTPEYMEDPNWQHGWVLVETIPETGRYHITDVPVVGGEVIYNGRLFGAE